MNRDIKIDFMRFIGISLIILAHVSPPNLIFQLRNFDVPLMVILSGYLYSIKNKQKNKFNLSYFLKRFRRLVIPVWIFLSILFIGIFLINPKMITLKLLLTSFTLYTGIGYVWIIRVYLIIALFGEILIKIINKNIIILFISYLIYELLCKIKIDNQFINDIYKNLFLIGFGYLLFFSYGVFFKSLKLNIKIILSSICLGSLIFKILTNGEMDLQYFKYPPRSYYFYYAILMFNFIFYLKEFLSEKKLEKIKIISFIGKSTMWIYLWHIPFVLLTVLLDKKGIKMNYLMNYIFIYGGALIITLIQNKLVISIFTKENKTNKVIKEILLG